MLRFSTLSTLVLLTFAASALAQPCTPTWVPGEGFPGVNGNVEASVVWDPDGAGPQPPRLVVGGSFSAAGTVPTSGIAMWDDTAWAGFGTGMNQVTALAVLPDGSLIAGGFFSTASGVPAANIARWSGTAWTPLGSGVTGNANSHVNALLVLPSGDLIVGGEFTSAGSSPARNIARWNGTAWSALGSGTSGAPNALAVLSNGNIVAGGSFNTAGGNAAENIAQWNGTAWSALGLGIHGQVNALGVLPNGTLVVGGHFDLAGNALVNSIATWDGTTWSALSSGVTGNSVYALTILPSSDIIIGGNFATAGGNPATNIARWNNSAWSPLGPGIKGSITSLTVLPGGNIVAAGGFTPGGSSATSSVAQWNGSSWLPLGSGMDYGVTALTRTSAGDTFAGGQFTVAGGAQVNAIAKRTSTGWVPLSSGMSASIGSPFVLSLASLNNGDIIAGGIFTSAGAVTANRIARWDGQQWSALGSGMTGVGTNVYVQALAVLTGGDVVAGGRFNAADGIPVGAIARWNGAAWSALGSGTDGVVNAIVQLLNGDIVIAGNFANAGGSPVNNIARWNGTTWSPLGSGLTSIAGTATAWSLAVLHNGDLIVGGSFSSAGGTPCDNIARWNGSTWTALGSGITGGTAPTVFALFVDPNDDVLIGGSFSVANGTPANNIVRWSTSTNQWFPLESGMDFQVRTIVGLNTSGYAVGGFFKTAGVNVSPYFARWTCPPCYANCDSSTSPPVLTANDFQCFLNKFAAVDPYANCDHSTNPPTLNVNDFQCFLNQYAAGCP